MPRFSIPLAFALLLGASACSLLSTGDPAERDGGFLQTGAERYGARLLTDGAGETPVSSKNSVSNTFEVRRTE